MIRPAELPAAPAPPAPEPDYQQFTEFREFKEFYRGQLGVLGHPRGCRCEACQWAVDLAMDALPDEEE